MRALHYLSNDTILEMRSRMDNFLRLTSKSRPHLPVWLICMLPMSIWLGSAAMESDRLGTLAALLGAWLSVLWWRRLLNHPYQMLGFLKIGAISLLMFMSLGWLVAVYMNNMELDRSVSQALEFEVGTSTSAYAGAVAYALCLAAVLGGIGELSLVKKLESSAVVCLASAQSVSLYHLIALLICINALEAALVINGIISYRAFAVEGYDQGSIEWYVPMLEIMFAVHICLNGLVLSLLMHIRKRSLIIGIVIISVLLLLFIYFTRGRSQFVLCAVLHLYWFCFFYGKFPSLKTLIPAVVIMIPILYTGSLFNNFMRSSDAGLMDIRTVGIASIMGEALNTWQSDQSLREIEKIRSAANLSTRPLSASPLAMSMALPTDRKEFMLGENLLNSAIWAIPSAIYSDKKNFRAQEDLIYQYFPVGTEDTADSLYLYAYTDFSFVGFVIYPFVIAALWIGSLWIIRLPVTPSFGVMVIVSSWIPFFTLSMGESSLIGWFGNMRNLILVLLICIPLAWLLGFIRRIRILR